ncbi:DUF1365 domain-containing protein [Alteromonas sp. C1M14]|uniref:DUF1365 domain-containing protein n=1 Tax=Alteromonas sp. C1M14 TaxID=2841567 RepID=UPI001C083669|nr:DUF1365 domain-containing protein [Alteromonas sp. C1M14]
MTQLESALYQGQVFHQRFRPTQHKFAYNIYLFWLKLSELDALDKSIKRFSHNGRNMVEFRRSDYYGDKQRPLEEAIREKMSALHGGALEGDVFMLGQLRMLGIYFSPVNFYFLRNSGGTYTHMLAEVSNTPWHEQHYYLVDLATQADTPKAFHVSPFNPMDMTYKWKIAPPADTFSLSMHCYQTEKDFAAGLNMTRISFNNKNLGMALRRIPSMTIKTMVGIYWQALKLFIKRTPIYDHP